MTKQQIHLVIVGGGFGGIKLARCLSRNRGIKITLISEEPDFRYSPALYRTATGHRGKESSVPLKSLIGNIPGLTLIEAKAVSINRTDRIIKTADGQRFTYDYAVLALGVVSTFFGIDGLEKFAYGIKSVNEVDRLRAHLHQELMALHALEKHYVVIGGGPTGVELAGALRYYLSRMAKRHHIKDSGLHIELIEAADRLLPSASPKASKLVTKRLKKLGVKVQTKCRVEGETADTLVANGRSIPTHTVIWTAGVTNNPFFTNNSDEFTLDAHKKVVVDDHLRVDERTFVIGDNAATPYSGLALTAIHNAKYVARYLQRISNGINTSPYRPAHPVSAIPVGPRWAVVQWRSLNIADGIGSIVRLFADLIGYTDIMGPARALKLWLKRYKYEDTCPVCKALTLEDIMNQ